MKTNIFYDHQIFSMQKTGGISRYFAELARHIENEKVRVSQQKYLTTNRYYNNKISIPFNFKGINRLQSVINGFSDQCELILNRYDIFHPTYYFPNSSFESFSGKKIITIHDMIHEIYPDQFIDSKILSMRKRELCIKADKIIAISNKTKEDLIRFFQVPEEKIEVIYHGASLGSINTEKPVTSALIPERFVLFVGSRGGYKNFSNTLATVSEIILKKKIYLVCVGGGSFNNRELSQIQQLGMSKNIMQLDLADHELQYAYRKALFFIFPSLYEGFGLPILEAFNSNCPVLLSNSSCFPEIAQDAAFYFENQNILADIFEKMIVDESFRKSKLELQTKRLSDFTWEKTAQKTMKVYQDTIKEK